MRLHRRTYRAAEVVGDALHHDRGAEIRRAERWALFGQLLVIAFVIIALLATVAVIAEIHTRGAR